MHAALTQCPAAAATALAPLLAAVHDDDVQGAVMAALAAHDPLPRCALPFICGSAIVLCTGDCQFARLHRVLCAWVHEGSAGSICDQYRLSHPIMPRTCRLAWNVAKSSPFAAVHYARVSIEQTTRCPITLSYLSGACAFSGLLGPLLTVACYPRGDPDIRVRAWTLVAASLEVSLLASLQHVRGTPRALHLTVWGSVRRTER